MLQDFTGVPLLCDLAAMRGVAQRVGKNPKVIEPLVPVDLVVDHSVQVDNYGTKNALDLNMKIEFQRNAERYKFMKWGMQAFDTFKVVPPGIGIVHQVNLEYLARGVHRKDGVYYPDTLVGTDSHTTMINGIGVVGWGVGGIEAEAGMLGQPVYFLTPDVVGVHFKGRLREGVTATDLVLTVTELLRKAKVVGKFVEFFGEGAASLAVPDRATHRQHVPEYGATMGFFPVDDKTLEYLTKHRTHGQRNRSGRGVLPRARPVRHAGGGFDRLLANGRARPGERDGEPRRPEAPAGSHRAAGHEGLVRYFVFQAGRRERIRPGPDKLARRYPVNAAATQQDRSNVAAQRLPSNGQPRNLVEMVDNRPTPNHISSAGPKPLDIGHGDVLIAAITSCTNTSNPSVLLAAGLLAKKAVDGADGQAAHQDLARARVARGHRISDQDRACCPISRSSASTSSATAARRASATPARWIRRSRRRSPRTTWCAPRCCRAIATSRRASTRTSGPISSPRRRWSSPMRSPARCQHRPHAPSRSATARTASPSYLRDIWPTREEIGAVMKYATDPATYRRAVRRFRQGQPAVERDPDGVGPGLQLAEVDLHRRAAVLHGLHDAARQVDRAIRGARALGIFGDSVTTDHISPAGSIKPTSPAGIYLLEHDVGVADFNSYGARRGNHEVMMRGTFANVRIKNLMLPPKADGTRVEGGVRPITSPSGEPMPIYDAAMEYIARRHADRRVRRRGIRHRQLARLGGEGHAAARRQGGDRPELRAHPPHPTWSAWACCPASSRAATARRRSASTAARSSTSSAWNRASGRSRMSRW